VAYGLLRSPCSLSVVVLDTMCLSVFVELLDEPCTGDDVSLGIGRMYMALILVDRNRRVETSLENLQLQHDTGTHYSTCNMASS
jgi:hypothetical protein